MTALTEQLLRLIPVNGPLRLDHYMAMALMHPQHGYYMKGSPIGAEGAFTTAPEISQMFGELLGAWLHQQWQSLGCPSPVDILELGPGRGTFMADVLRVTRLDPAFTRAASVRLVEPSPLLRAMQQDRLRPFAVPVTWHSSLASVPLEGPVLIFANEVFDALPVRHLKRGPKGWHERYIDVEEGRLVWRFAADVTPDVLIPAALRQSADGAIVEISPARAGLMAEICGQLQTRDGAALIVDYGYAQSQLGETLQALRRHQPVDPLQCPGEADLTAHVDFEALRAVVPAPLKAHGPVAQGDLLRALGLAARVTRLQREASAQQSAAIAQAAHRLADEQAMGQLFKALAICHEGRLPPPGFAP